MKRERNSFWRLLGYMHNYKVYVGLNIFSNVMTAVFTALSIPLLVPFLEILFDRRELVLNKPTFGWDIESAAASFNYYISQLVVEQGKEAALVFVCVAILSVFLLKNMFRYLSLFFMAPVRNGIIRDLRAQMYDKVMALPLAYFSEERKGDLMSRMTSDVQEVEWSILNVLEAVFREPLIIIGALGFMVYVSPALTGFVFLLMIFTGVVIGGIGRRLKKKSADVQDRLGNLVSILEEGLGGLRIIKGFNAEHYQKEKFRAENDGYRRSLTRLLWRRDLASPLSEFLGIGTVAVLLWYGSRQVFSGQLDAETFLTFIFAFYNVIDPAKKLSKAVYNVQKGVGAMRRMESLLDAPVNIKDAPGALPLQSFQQGIEYRNVTFGYRQDEGPVLQNINLSIPKGTVVALVGASGAGKSTLADLLPRFYDVEEGEILLDGQNIKKYRLRDLRNLMGIVSQEAILFNDSIYNNIVFGLEGVTQEQVEAAARAANAHDFIMASEQGYQTNIGDRGSKLSGGQRQRLTIARAILKNPPILILDEATSALDSESEKLVQKALLELMKNRTSVVIAHRLSTIQHADEILVMRDGQIMERGTHATLLQEDGEYQKLVELQAF
ncbi:MAG: ABC transporter ATP-binding protein [Phaeodactylibacter sp.]|uniref:ABC transporter ATP-binding protein n=1 Tax=Phaeodactylibacter sp. TaxID=1940289 RepID=UPI0032EED750